jgi:hypothetical protein
MAKEALSVQKELREMVKDFDDLNKPITRRRKRRA